MLFPNIFYILYEYIRKHFSADGTREKKKNVLRISEKVLPHYSKKGKKIARFREMISVAAYTSCDSNVELKSSPSGNSIK